MNFRTTIASISVSSLILIQPAVADVYVKVDAQGNAIGGAIICDSATCAPGSQYSQLTLAPGESYALQGYGQAGIGNNNPNTEVKVNLQTNEWTVTNTSTPVPSVQTFVPTHEVAVPQPTPTPTPAETVTPVVDTPTVIIDTVTVISDTSTVLAIAPVSAPAPLALVASAPVVKAIKSVVRRVIKKIKK